MFNISLHKNMISSGIVTPSLVSKTLYVKGNLVSKGTVEVEGKVEGNINGDIVTLREGGFVTGDIDANVVNIKGRFEGSVIANRLNVAKEARLSGNIRYVSLSVEDGASIDGQLQRITKKEKEK